MTLLLDRTGKKRWRLVGAALAFGLAVHVAMLGLMRFGSERFDWPTSLSNARPITLVFVPHPSRYALGPNVPHLSDQRQWKVNVPPVTLLLPTSPSPNSPAPVTPKAALPGDGGPNPGAAPGNLAKVLRGGLLGCANADAIGLNEKEREGCRQRLAAGAGEAAYLSAVPAEKLAYYDAVAKANADWLSDRNEGHVPYIKCTFGPGKAQVPGHALKAGPCFLDPPVGSLDIDADVPPPAR
jgi:hypothetical protein